MASQDERKPSRDRARKPSQDREKAHNNRDRPRKRRSVPGPEVAGRATEQLLQLTGREVEGVVALERVDHNGWKVQVEVLEVRRIPDTTDVLALYEVDADEEGSLVGYRRLRRYSRGTAGDGGRSR